MEAKQYSPPSRRPKIRRSGQRTPLAMISNMAARHVCFTKRRRGLFKKVCELSTLCGADLLAFVTSNAGKLYSIGTPNVPAAVERFLRMQSGEVLAAEAEPQPTAPADDHRVVVVQQLHQLEKLFQEIGALERTLEELRKLRALLQRSTEEKAGRLPRQWVQVLGELPTHELEEMMASLEELLAKVLMTTSTAEAAALNHRYLLSSSAASSPPPGSAGPASYSHHLINNNIMVPVLPAVVRSYDC